MNSKFKRIICIVVLPTLAWLTGCEQPAKIEEPNLVELQSRTIGSVAEIFAFNPIMVEGYGIVAELAGTGSAECPPSVRTFLSQYIMQQLPAKGKIDVEEFINSLDTAVVRVYGMIPPGASRADHFDLKIVALPGTQTKSLKGGKLYTCDLRVVTRYEGGFGASSKILAAAQGPVFMDQLTGKPQNQRFGYILNGGTVLDNYRLKLGLFEPDYTTATFIRNRLNQRFGKNTADAVSNALIYINIPQKYKDQKLKFLYLMRSIYMIDTPALNQQRIENLIGKLVTAPQKQTSEIALEAIGKAASKKLAALLNSSDSQIRFHAARCLLSIGDDSALATLRDMAIKPNPYRKGAIEAIGVSARRNDATAILGKCLRDPDLEIKLAAYEHLRRLDDISVTKRVIAGNFYLERIALTGPKTIFASRSGEPKIIFFGEPIRCQSGIFIESADAAVTIDAPEGAEHISLIRRQDAGGFIGPLKASFDLADVLKALCDPPPKENQRTRGGLGVSYSHAIAILKQMCEKGAVNARFQAGPLPK